jgi:hypothetical protein
MMPLLPLRLVPLLAFVLPALPLRADITPEALELTGKVTAKLAAAPTVKVTAKHALDPRLGVGAGHEKGPIQVTLARPNRFHALQPAGLETRELAYDGATLCLMHPQLKHHALVPLKAANVDALADLADARLGFRPPLAELLSADFSGQILRDVTTASVSKGSWIGFSRCDLLTFEQPGLRGELWIAQKDSLPRRYRLTFTDVAGQPTWDIRLTGWQLGVPVDAALFSRRPAADSQLAPMLKSR